MGVRVAIMDPLPIFRQGAVAALSAAGHQVDTPADIVRWADDPAGGIVVLTVVSEDDWLELTRLGADRSPVKVLALLEDSAVAVGMRAVRAGAISLLPRHATPKVLCGSVDAIIDGRAVLPVEVVTSLAAESRGRDVPVPVSPRRIAWLRELASGLTVAQLADQVGYSERAMYRLLRSLYRDLGVASRVEALVQAQERGWLR